MAMWDYDRVKALEDGRARIEGVDLNFLNLRCVREISSHDFCAYGLTLDFNRVEVRLRSEVRLTIDISLISLLYRKLS